jgi:cell division protein FtsW
MIAIQSVFNFAVVTGLVPTKGLPLPFISYGGTSLVVSMVAAGLLLNVSRFREASRQGHEIYHVRSRLPEDDALSAGEMPKANQYALGRGYGQYRTKTSYFRKSGKKP